jgi:hypothetical protein
LDFIKLFYPFRFAKLPLNENATLLARTTAAYQSWGADATAAVAY